MYLLNVMKYTFLKSPIRILHHCRRNIVSKKRSSWLDFSPFPPAKSHGAFERMQNSKLTPKGFEVIYTTPMLNFIKWAYITVSFCWGSVCFDTYIFFKNPEDYLAKIHDRVGKISYKDKIYQIGVFTFLILTLHLSLLRVVVATFRKQNEFQTLFYGFLGPLTKNYVPHGFKAMEQTASTAIYNFKGKKVFLLSNGFRHYKDLESVIALKTY